MRIKDYLEKRKAEKKKAARKKAAKNATISVGVGAAVGLTAGVLLAPKAGKETREDIANNAKKAADVVSENTKKAVDKVSETSKKAVGTVRETINDAKAKIAERKACKVQEEMVASEENNDDTDAKGKE